LTKFSTEFFSQFQGCRFLGPRSRTWGRCV